MKKLMTMIAAVATAFGLYAADTDIISGAAFDTVNPTLSAGTLTWTVTDTFLTSYWSGIDGTMTATEGDASKERSITRPSGFIDHEKDQYMAVKTTLGNPAFMSVLPTSKQEIGAGLYFDGLVKLTAFDETPQDYDGKIAVYLKISENETATNLFVRAATAAGATNDYPVVVSGGIAPDTWYRLTIKAIEDIDGADTVAFMVFVDGNAVMSTDAAIASGLKPQYANWGKAGKLFRSLGGTDNEIEGVGFDGQGAIDDIVFTTVAPDFAKDPDMMTVQWPSSVEKVRIDNGEWMTVSPTNIDLVSAGTIEWIGNGTTCDGSKDFEKLASGDTLDISGDVKAAVASVTIGATTTKFKALEGTDGAIAAVNGATEAPTLKLLDNAAGDVIAISGSAAVTLDLNGNNVAAGVSESPFSIKVNTGKNLTIIGEGTVSGAAIKMGSGVLTIENGTFDGEVTASTINGGKFKSMPTYTTIPDYKKFVSKGDYLELGDAAEVATITVNTEQVDFSGVAVGARFAKDEEINFTVAAKTGFQIDSVKVGETSATQGSGDAYTYTVTDADVAAKDLTITVVSSAVITDHNVTINWSDGEGARITAVSYTIDGQAGTPVNGTPFTVADGKTITVTATTVDWWKCDPVEMTISKDETITLTPVAISDTEIDDPGKTAAEVAAAYGVTNAKFTGNKTLLKSVVTWATASATRTVADVNEMTFDEAGNPTSDTATAYLLNCDVNAIEATEATFKFSSIVPGKEVPTVDENNFNGDVKYFGADEVTGPWGEATKDSKFYKATLVFPAAE